MTQQTTETEKPVSKFPRRDIHQQVTDTIIQQLEAGTVPWDRPWIGNSNYSFGIPENFTTGKRYRGINIVLLWSSAIKHNFATNEWGSFRQWQGKSEAIRKGEKGSLIVYYDTLEREVDGELKKIPFLKQSIVFNRCQLANYKEGDTRPKINDIPLVERIAHVDTFISNTNAIIEHKDFEACYMPLSDKIHMPLPEAFIDTEKCSATEGYYSTVLHELTHWSGGEKRLNRIKNKKWGDQHYATEELVAELGAAFLCAEFDITTPERKDYAAYIASWLKVLKDNRQCVITAASEASKAVDYLKGLTTLDLIATLA